MAGGLLDQPQQLSLYSELEWQSNEVLIFLLLGRLRERYLQMARNVAATDDWSFNVEGPIASSVWFLLTPEDYISPEMGRLPYSKLVDLANERFRQRCLREEQDHTSYILIPDG